MLYYKINLSLLQTLEKALQEESSWHDRFSQPVFLKHLNKTHQGIMCETKIRIAYIKKHVYKESKETTHVEVGVENEHTSSSYIRKIKYNVCHNKNGHKTGVQEANVIKKKVKYI